VAPLVSSTHNSQIGISPQHDFLLFLRALQGHPNIIRLIALCPSWDRYVAVDSEEFRTTLEEVTLACFGNHFNTIVTPFQENGDLENIERVLQSGRYPNNWQQRLKIAIDYARVISHLHNAGLERNPFSRALVQKDRKVSQFLLDDNLALLLNDVEAMPFALDDNDIRTDLEFMPVVMRKIFGEANLPASLRNTLNEIYSALSAGERPTVALTAPAILDALLRAVDF